MKKQSKNEDELVLPIDVDDTLIIRNNNDHDDRPGRIEFIDPANGKKKYYKPHFRHIELLKHFSDRGFFIIVWSGSGGKWAKEVVKKLGLDAWVDIKLCKPSKYMDDKGCETWMGNRMFFPELYHEEKFDEE